MDMRKVGGRIAALRRGKGLTQEQLGDRLGVTFQAVSKWERGETLPDTALLPDLAAVRISFRSEKWRDIVLDDCHRFTLK